MSDVRVFKRLRLDNLKPDTMNRRQFVKTSGMACGAIAMPGVLSSSLLAATKNTGNLFNVPRPIDIKLNVKPLFGVRVPVELHEGPCRPNDPSGWDRRKEISRVQASYQRWWENLPKSINSNKVKLLEPVYAQFAGDHRIEGKDWDKILAEDQETDLYLITNYRIPGLEIHTDKPIAFVGNNCATLDVVAKVNSEGGIAYGALDFEEFNHIVDCLKVKKALGNTKLLIVSDGEWNYEYNATRSNIDPDILEKAFGVRAHYISIAEMMGEYEKVLNDEIYINEANRITKSLLKNAEKSLMTAENIKPSIIYYLTAKKVMEEEGCNAFTATCQEFCVSKMAMKYKVTPCITHSLLKDEAFPSVCEADVNVFFSMALQMYLADRSAYMGNTVVHNVENNLLEIHHDVPALKMKGFDQPDLPYNLVHFTERGWGATMRYDFSRDRGEAVTFCRMTPKADKILVVKGEMIDANGLESWGCSLQAVVKVSDARHYYRRAMQTGHHFSMIYGDFTDQMEQLAEILGIDFEVV